MQLDRQSARELAEACIWLEEQVTRLWNFTLGRVFGLSPLPELKTLATIEEEEEEDDL